MPNITDWKSKAEAFRVQAAANRVEQLERAANLKNNAAAIKLSACSTLDQLIAELEKDFSDGFRVKVRTDKNRRENDFAKGRSGWLSKTKFEKTTYTIIDIEIRDQRGPFGLFSSSVSSICFSFRRKGEAPTDYKHRIEGTPQWGRYGRGSRPQSYPENYADLKHQIYDLIEDWLK